MKNIKVLIFIFILLFVSTLLLFPKKGPNGYHLVIYKLGDVNSGGSRLANIRTMEVYADNCQMAHAVVLSKVGANTIGGVKLTIISCEASGRNNIKNIDPVPQQRIQR